MAFRFTWHTAREGAPCWAPFGNHGWRPAIIEKVPRKGGIHVGLIFCNRVDDWKGARGKRRFDELRLRDPELKGKDKPRPLAELEQGAFLKPKPSPQTSDPGFRSWTGQYWLPLGLATCH